MVKRSARLPIRYKFLLAIAGTLAFAVASVVWLATSLYSRDKLAYVYDLSSSLVMNLAEQTNANLTVLARSTASLGRSTVRPEDVEELFAAEPDLLRVQVLSPGPDGRMQVAADELNLKTAKALGLDAAALELVRAQSPVSFEAALASTAGFTVQNASLAPDAPLLTLVQRVESVQGPRVVVADFRHDRLLRLFTASKTHVSYLLDGDGVVLAHPNPAFVLERQSLRTSDIFTQASAREGAQGVREVKSEDGQPLLAAFAPVAAGRLLVVTQVPKKDALVSIAEVGRRSILFGIAVLLIALMAAVLLSRAITAPIQKLKLAADDIGHGQYDLKVPIAAGDEIGDLARSFEDMGRRVKAAQAQLVRSEKMAAFGQLGASVTHEIRNPMTSIIGLANIARTSDEQQMREMLGVIEKEGQRCADILNNLLKFARSSGSEVQPLDLNEVVRSSAAIFGHQLRLNQVKLEQALAESLPVVSGNANELQQVLVNLAINAQQAMPGGGTLRLTTREDAGQVVLEVTDNGPGIPEAIRERIFDPFFTTKPPGEGTGLGLAISYRILEDHGGSLTVASQVGKGTTFALRLPVLQASAPMEAA